MIARVQKGGKWGVVNSQGKLIIPVVYDDVQVKDFYNYESEAVKVKKGELWGIINLKGEEIVPCTYSEIWSFQSGMSKVLYSSEGETYGGFINKNGQLKIAIKDWYNLKNYYNGDYVEYTSTLGGVCRIDKEGKWYKKQGDNWILTQ